MGINADKSAILYLWLKFPNFQNYINIEGQDIIARTESWLNASGTVFPRYYGFYCKDGSDSFADVFLATKKIGF